MAYFGNRQYGFGGVAPSIGKSYGIAQIGIGMAEALRAHAARKQAGEQESYKRSMQQGQFNLQIEQFEEQKSRFEKDMAQREQQLKIQTEQFEARQKLLEKQHEESTKQFQEGLTYKKEKDIADRGIASKKAFQDLMRYETESARQMAFAEQQYKRDEQRHLERMTALDRQTKAAERVAGARRTESAMEIQRSFSSAYKEATDDYLGAMPNYTVPTKEIFAAAESYATTRAVQSAKMTYQAFNLSMEQQGLETVSEEKFEEMLKVATGKDVDISSIDADEISTEPTAMWVGTEPDVKQRIIEMITSGEPLPDTVEAFRDIAAQFPDLGTAFTERDKNEASAERKAAMPWGERMHTSFKELMGAPPAEIE